MFKKILSLSLACLLTLASLTALSACGKDAAYKDDVPAATLLAAAVAAAPTDSGYDISSSDADYYQFYFNSDPAIDGYAFAFSTASSDINEIGVLHARSEADVAAVKALAEAYLTTQKAFYASFVNTYNASETEKLDAATVRVFGNYVLFFILSGNDLSNAAKAAEGALK